jgi:hypothetical protein
MNPKLKVSFNSPQSGFMSIGLKTDGQSFVTAVSHQPHDSVRDLIKALLALLDGEERALVKWNQEPEEYDFELTRSGQEVQLKIIRYPDHHRTEGAGEQIFAHTDSLGNISHTFREALQRLHRDRRTDEYAKNWRREFPEAEYQQLQQRLRA